MIFTLHIDEHGNRTVTVDEFEKKIEVAYELVDQSDESLLRMEEHDLVFTLANGAARYRITEHNNEQRIITAELASLIEFEKETQ